MERCGWVSQDQLYIDYHDREWGVPERDGKKLFEMICLEGQQAGLSWITVLKKRENYRSAFHQFDPVAVAAMTDEDVERLVQDAGIIRHLLEIHQFDITDLAFPITGKFDGLIPHLFQLLHSSRNILVKLVA